jgi:sigma-B regulation protein RsbU (phosphoserine phosphatase)
VRATPHLRGSYLVLLTARAGAWNVVEGLQSGADEFLVKPFDRLELRARIGSGSRVLGLQADLARRVGELEEALRTVDRLEGLLPICSCCKRIRQGDHSWGQVEDFVAERSRARFSHGLCPDCLVREAHGLRQEAPAV